MTSGTIFDIKRYAINDGPGIRTAVFLKGCPLECAWCHNPEGQSTQPQLMFRLNRCKAFKACIEACPRNAVMWQGKSITLWEECDQCGKCAQVCVAGAREMVGRMISVDELMAEVKRDIPFYDQSGGGVTYTGGEPLQQMDFLQAALAACKKMNIHTAVDTSGHAAWESFEQILSQVDLFLYDLKLIDDAKHKQYTSVSNHMILNNLIKLSAAEAHIVVRIPLIPGINDDEDNIIKSAKFLSNLPHLDGIELMPYHEIGITKYESLGMKYQLEHTKPPSRGDIERVEEIFVRYNLPLRGHFSGKNT